MLHTYPIQPRRYDGSTESRKISNHFFCEPSSQSDFGQWHHVRMDLNVADIATRGVAANDLKPES
jgi:hypothetical protein